MGANDKGRTILNPLAGCDTNTMAEHKAELQLSMAISWYNRNKTHVWFMISYRIFALEVNEQYVYTTCLGSKTVLCIGVPVAHESKK